MKLPNLEQASISMAKIEKYLLSRRHPAGGSKAVFFLRFGFDAAAPQRLERALRNHARDHEVTSTQVTRYGMAYAVEGALDTPDGRQPRVRSVWFIDRGTSVPRFISAYPLHLPRA